MKFTKIVLIAALVLSAGSAFAHATQEFKGKQPNRGNNRNDQIVKPQSRGNNITETNGIKPGDVVKDIKPGAKGEQCVTDSGIVLGNGC